MTKPSPPRTSDADAPRKAKSWSRDSKIRIVDAASELFATKGYRETTISQIGAAVGLTGPAIYRHYKSKAELLEAVIERGAEPAWLETRNILAKGGEPRQVLLRTIGVWVEQALSTTWIIALYTQEHAYLDEATRMRIRTRYRELSTIWADLLGEIHPDLSRLERITMIDSAFWLIRSPAFYRSSLPQERLQDTLMKMMAGALSIV